MVPAQIDPRPRVYPGFPPRVAWVSPIGLREWSQHREAKIAISPPPGVPCRLTYVLMHRFGVRFGARRRGFGNALGLLDGLEGESCAQASVIVFEGKLCIVKPG